MLLSTPFRYQISSATVPSGPSLARFVRSVPYYYSATLRYASLLCFASELRYAASCYAPRKGATLAIARYAANES